MPPNSHSIFEEGAVFKSFKIVKEGVLQEEGKINRRLHANLFHVIAAIVMLA